MLRFLCTSRSTASSVVDPLPYFDANVHGTAALLRAMRSENVQRIVFSSSCATYGLPERLPLTEDAPQRPISPYGWSKLAAEQLIKASARAYRFEYVLLRYFNAAGADPESEIGEVHDPETHLIPNAVNAALVDQAQLVVYGTDYDTPDGTCIRDFVHVTDLAHAHVLALRALERGQVDLALILDLGANIGLSVLFFKTRYPGARVVAFEADPRIYAYLTRNLEVNGIRDVKTVSKAAWDADEQLTFLREGADAGRVSRTGSGTPVSVEAVHLGRFLAAQHFDFIKMDIEGAETRVVPVCKRLLGTAKWVFIEYHSSPGERQSLADILSLLRDLGFRVYIQTENVSPRPFLEVRTQAGYDLQLNVMATREGQPG